MTRVWGMKPTAVENGPLALACFETAQQKREPFRIIVIDSNMPIMDGFELAEKIEAMVKSNGFHSENSVLMLTSRGRPGEADRCRQLGISAYLLKPVAKSELLAAIRTALTERQAQTFAKPPLITRHTLRESAGKLRILVAEDNAVNQVVI